MDGIIPSADGALATFAQHVLTLLPPCRFAAAYGSAVLSQRHRKADDSALDASSSASSNRKMVDFILGVDDPMAWHRANMDVNPHHYQPLLRMLGATAIGKVLTPLGGHIFYNALVSVPWAGSKRPRLVKYGVISTTDLKVDLLAWPWLYVSGRLHKPTLVLQTTDGVAGAMEENLRHAVRVARLFLPGRFDERQLFRAVTRLSYMGDIRVSVGAEDPRKVQSIVDGGFAAFQQLYNRKILGECGLRYSLRHDELLQETSNHARAELLCALPGSVRRRMGLCEPDHGGAQAVKAQVTASASKWDVLSGWHRNGLGLDGPSGTGIGSEGSVEDDTRSDIDPAIYDHALDLVISETYRVHLVMALHDIVRQSSFAQGLKGFASLGVSKSLRYVSRKVRKGLLG